MSVTFTIPNDVTAGSQPIALFAAGVSSDTQWVNIYPALVTMAPGVPFQSDVRSIGIRMFEAYIFPFEMVSILLLAAIVGSLLLTQREKRAAGEGEAR